MSGNGFRQQLAVIGITAAVTIVVSVTSTLAACWSALESKVSREEATRIAQTQAPFVTEKKAIEAELQSMRERLAAADARIEAGDNRLLAYNESMRDRMREIEQKFTRIDVKLEILLERIEEK